MKVASQPTPRKTAPKEDKTRALCACSGDVGTTTEVGRVCICLLLARARRVPPHIICTGELRDRHFGWGSKPPASSNGLLQQRACARDGDDSARYLFFFPSTRAGGGWRVHTAARVLDGPARSDDRLRLACQGCVTNASAVSGGKDACAHGL